MYKFLVIGIIFINTIDAHSWAECTKYDDDVVAPYQQSKCKGFPRAFERQFDAGFGIDTGFNDEVGKGAASIPCPAAYNPNLYNNKVVMANYTPGQIFNMAWPAKNHVADVCTNQFIPDGGVVVLRSVVPETDDFIINIPMVKPQHVNGQIDKLGFQRCFDFCNNKDLSPCYNTFQLDTNFYTSGVYSFKWIWTFNPGQYFITCYDAYVTVDNPIIIAPNNTGDNYTDTGSNNAGSNNDDVITLPPVTTPPVTTPPVTTQPVTTQPVTTQPVTTQPVTTQPPTTRPPTEVTSRAPSALMQNSLNQFISGLITLNMTGWFNTTNYFNN